MLAALFIWPGCGRASWIAGVNAFFVPFERNINI
jgi:hypothetical protein